MAKLSDADVRRFVSALERGEALDAAAPSSSADSDMEARSSDALPDTPADLAERLQSAPGEAIGSAIERALRKYLNVELRCTFSANAAVPVHALWFESAESERWALALDAPLAYGLSDLMLGGDGKTTRPGNRVRLGALLEPLARRVISAAADASGAPTPGTVKTVERVECAPERIIGGEMAMGSITGGWSVARDVAAASDAMNGRMPPAAPEAEIVHAHAPPKAEISSARSRSRDRILTARAASDSHSPLARAVEAACANLGDLTHCAAVVETVRITLVESPTLPRDDLKLALIAGGQGSLVLSADRAATAVVADAVAGAHVGEQGGHVEAAEQGAVVIGGVETVLRAAMRGFAQNLPGLASGPQRFVRLAESAMLARSPHFAIVAPVRLDGAIASLAWLVPAWMAEAGEARPPE